METRILRGFEGDFSVLPQESIGKILYDKIKSHPQDKIAVVDLNTEEKYTYGQIIKYSVNLAKNLKLLGINKDVVIAISSESNCNYFVIALAALYNGTPLHLLNPAYTSYELEHILELTNPKLIFCTKTSLKSIEKARKNIQSLEIVILIDDSPEFTNLLKDVDIDFQVEQNFDLKEQVGIIANSSGTTGTPKATLLTHESLRPDLVYIGIPSISQFNPNDNTILVPPLYHIYGWGTLRAFLYGGATVFLLNPFNPHLFLSTIEKERTRVLFLVPSLINFLAKSPMVNNYDLSSVDDILNAAGPPSEECMSLICKRFINVKRVRQIYGATELVSMFTMTPFDEYRKGSCGKLTPFKELKVINPETGDVLGANQSGELCTKGAGFKGYASDEGTVLDEDGFFHTGDIGYYDSDGFVYIVDRLKDLIKYKSYQVPPLELENILMKHPAVKEAAVVGKPDSRFGELPVAFVVKKEGIDVTETELIDFVAQFVSEQKQLHGGVRFIEEIPKNSIGKPLKRNLRDLFH